jgi:carboxyl-terminal processing protease
MITTLERLPRGALLVAALVLLTDSCAARQATPSPAPLAQEVAEILAKQHLSHPDAKALLAHSLGDVDSVLGALADPETRRLSPAEFALFVKDTSGTTDTTGLGLTELLSIDIGVSGIPVVVTPVPGSSAAKAGLRARDEVLDINGHFTDGAAFGKTMSWLREGPGPVKLTVRRAGKVLPSFELNRVPAFVPREHVPKAVHLSKDVGYVRLEAFYEGLEVPLRVALNELGVSRLVLDLRDNPGGAVSTALEVTGALAGSIPAAEGLSGQGSRAFQGQIIVLVNEGTASAAELVAGALQSAGRATLVGTRTFGKGLLHAGASLSEGSTLIVSAGRVITPSGRDILKDGIAPDVVVPTPDSPMSRKFAPTLTELLDDPQVRAAVALLMNDPKSSGGH